MKNAIILQGAGETQKSFWLPYVKKELIKRDYQVWLPQLPNNDDPDLKLTLPFVLKNGKFNKNTVIIAHSAGCPLALAVLQNLETKIKQVILVAGYWRELPPPGANKSLSKEYDWKKIKNNVEDIIFINSDNDPWGCDDKQGREMLEKLGGGTDYQTRRGAYGFGQF